MKHMFYNFLKKLLLFAFGGFFVFSFVWISRADLLNNVIEDSELLGASDDDVDSIGEDIFGDDSWVIVNITNILLRVTTAGGVTMIIFGWIKFVLAMGDEGKFKDARKFVVWVIVWIVLALSSTWIVALIESFYRTVDSGELSYEVFDNILVVEDEQFI